MTIPFTFQCIIWKLLEWYVSKIIKVHHPVKAVTCHDTAVNSIKVLVIPELWDNYSYIVTNENDAIVIDPSDYATIFNELANRELQLKAILLTHEHIDHMIGVVKLQKQFGVPIVVSKNASVPRATLRIEDNYKFVFGSLVFQALSVPGHHSFPYPISTIYNNVAWYCQKAQILFTGDTLFSCGYGYLAKGHEKEMWESLKHLRSLPDETLMFCGHEYTRMGTMFAAEIDPDNLELRQRLLDVNDLLSKHQPTIPTTLKLEKAINPWLRWDDEKLNKRLEISDMGSFEKFLFFRKRKNAFNKRK